MWLSPKQNKLKFTECTCREENINSEADNTGDGGGVRASTLISDKENPPSGTAAMALKPNSTPELKGHMMN
jgi:hypothetical protein